MNIDLNADVAEGYAFDEPLLSIVSSANICAGLHAGGVHTMAKTLQFAKQNGTRVGAHPSYDDRANFGRSNYDLTNLHADDIRALMFYQLGAVQAMCRQAGLSMSYVKPHGALYNQASANRTLADMVVGAIHDFDPSLAVMGLSGGELIHAASAIGLPTILEAFADRRYEPNGMLVARSQPNALIDDENEAINQVLLMATKGQVIATDGKPIDLQVDSICLHGDGKHALDFAKKIKTALLAHGIGIAAN